MKDDFRHATPQEKASKIIQRWNDLKQQREPFFDYWQQVSKFVAPYSGRFEKNDHNKRRSQRFILDSHASHDLNILASGMMSGASSPARPWFKIAPEDADLAENYQVISWCDQVEQKILQIFQKSNTYNTLHQMYKELGLFGTAVDIVYDDEKNVIRHHLLTAGEYCVASNAEGVIDTLYRNFELTTIQAVKFFGYDNIPNDIRQAYDAGNLSIYWEFIHAIEPRIDRDYNAKDNLNMPWASYYVSVSSNLVIRESGFKYFPCVVPRWDVLGIDPYGVSPAMEQLPNIKQLQQETLRKAELIENYTKPPMQAPNSARQQAINLSAGAINFTSSTGSEQQIRPIITSVGDLNAIRQDIAEIKVSIDKGFYTDLFMMVQNTAGDRRTTVEIYALQQEQMLTLGAVVERMQNEMLGRLVEIAYNKLYENDLLPEMPQALEDKQLAVKYTSVLSQAQKSVDINAVDRFFSALSASVQIMPEVLDRLDPDGYVDEYRDRLGVAPKLLRSKEDAQKIRQQRAQAQAQQQEQLEQMQGLQNDAMMAQAQKTGAEASLAMQRLDNVGVM